ncbi:hypothetical protein GCM10023201_47830 [Actinomycetospora corticicola]
MPDSASPTTIRFDPRDRALIEAVAHACDMTLSEYIREASLAAARGYRDTMGMDTVLERDQAYLEERARRSSRSADRRRALLEDVATEDPGRPRG